MKKFFALCLCAFLICATPIIAYAEGESSEPVEQETTVPENLPTEEEAATESEIPADTDIVETPEPVETPEQTVPDKIVNFIKENYEGSSFLSLAVTIAVYTFFAVKKHKSLSGTIGILNNNAIKVASDSTNTINDVMSKAGVIVENSSQAMKNILAEAGAIGEIVKGYKEEFEAALAELRKNAAEKQSLEDTLLSVQKTLETSKLASMELANEVAELLVLANIPVSKKEELYARHRAAVDAIATVENTEVVTNDGIES